MLRTLLSLCLFSLCWIRPGIGEDFSSHPPARPLPVPSNRPLPDSPVRFVDPAKGDDNADGSESTPWRTLAHATGHLGPGASLILRGGVYHENVAVLVRGTAEKPVVIRSYPGELAILDGGIPEFLNASASAWEPVPDGAPDEYRSVRAFPGLGEKDGSTWLLGNFADSMTPLHGYRFLTDLRADNEYFAKIDAGKTDAGNGIYSGPGVWYDVETGRIHSRFSPTTQLCLGDDNYSGETDPRKMPLVIAGGPDSTLHLDRAAHVVIQDLVVRGSRQGSINLTDCANITLDNVTAYGGSSALRVNRTSGLRCLNSAFRGIAAPWTWRGSLKYRAIEAKIVAASSWNPPARPNRDFEFAYCEFTDCVDGVFLGNVEGVRIHHCLLDHISDDGFFVTCRAGYDGETRGGDIHVYQNVLSRCLTTFAFGVGHGRQRTIEDPNTKQLGEGIWITRNLFDFRKPVHYQQPGEGEPKILTYGRTTGDHGGPAWEPMFVYHNTILQAEAPWRNYYGDGFAKSMGKGTARRVFNNHFYHFRGMPGDLLPDPKVDFAADGNRHWSVEMGPEGLSTFLKKNQSEWAGSDRYEDPQFSAAPETGDLDLRSPHKDGGIEIPADWPDPLRKSDDGKPDIGMLPDGLDGNSWRVGADGRLDAFGNEASGDEIEVTVTPFEFPAEALLARRAAILKGYPAFTAPPIQFALEKAGFRVDLYEKTWLPVSQYEDYQVIFVTGDLQRAKMEPFSYSNREHGEVVDFLENGGTLVMTRGTAGQLFAGDTGRRKLHAITGAVSHRSFESAIRKPEHPWIAHLDANVVHPWMTSRNIIPIGMTLGENLIGDAIGKSQLGRVKVGEGQLIYIGWIIGQAIPEGRRPSTVAQEEAYEAQYRVLEAIVADLP